MYGFSFTVCSTENLSNIFHLTVVWTISVVNDYVKGVPGLDQVHDVHVVFRRLASPKRKLAGLL